MAFLTRRGAQDFTAEHARQYLWDIENGRFTGNLVSRIPSSYRSGDIFTLYARSDWESDARGWRQKSRTTSCGVQKTFYNIIVGKNSKNTTGFRKIVYKLNNPTDLRNPALLVHFYGDDTLGVTRPLHGNTKNLGSFVRKAEKTVQAIQTKKPQDMAKWGEVAALKIPQIVTHTCYWEKTMKSGVGTCNAGFASAKDLQTHLTDWHVTDETRPSHCHWKGCPKGNAQKQKTILEMTSHVLVHSGDKPYKCSHEGCNKEYARNKSLLTHLKSHHLQPFPYVA